MQTFYVWLPLNEKVSVWSTRYSIFQRNDNKLINIYYALYVETLSLSSSEWVNEHCHSDGHTYESWEKKMKMINRKSTSDTMNNNIEAVICFAILYILFKMFMRIIHWIRFWVYAKLLDTNHTNPKWHSKDQYYKSFQLN